MDGFTLVLCRAEGCAGTRPPAARGPVEQELSDTTRRCAHGVMVLAGCLMGPTLCRAGGPSSGQRAGRLAVVQPCHASRQPAGPAVLVGPIQGGADAAELGRWLRSGQLVADALPEHLLGYARLLRAAAAN